MKINVLSNNYSTIYSWGYNNYGQLGDNTNEDKYKPITINIPTTHSIKQVCAGMHHSIALDDNGNVYAWGRNNNGQLGNETNTDEMKPIKIKMPNDAFITQISTHDSTTFALDDNGVVYGWGKNTSAQLGDDTTNDRNSPILIIGHNNVINTYNIENNERQISYTRYKANQNKKSGSDEMKYVNKKHYITKANNKITIKQIATGLTHSVALDTDGNLYVWGTNNHGQIRDGSKVKRYVPTKLDIDVKFDKIFVGSDHNLALDKNNNLYGWGNNEYNKISSKYNSKDILKPTKIDIDINPKFVSAGVYHSLAITSSHEIYTWGQSIIDINNSTKNNNTISKHQYEYNNYKYISAGMSFSVAIDINGNMYSWGSNQYGRLGIGNKDSNRYTKKLIVIHEKITKVSAGRYHVLAIIDENVNENEDKMS